MAPPSSIDDLERRTFRWFWETANQQTWLVPDRWPTQSFSSIAAVGFGLTAYAIGAERGYVTRAEGRDRVRATLQSLLAMPQSAEPANVSAYHGFFYHFLDMSTGARYKQVELSTIDSTWLFAGALFCQSYFDGDDPAEKAIRDAAEQLYERAEWDWAQPRPPAITMGWYPESGFHTSDWRGYNEAMMVIILALGSPTHPVDAAAWNEYTKTYKWGKFYGQQHLLFAPLFGHQYTQMFIDFRGIQDPYMRGKGIDYFENSRRATLSQRAHAIDNPAHWKDYGANIWGLTACDGPGDVTIDGRAYHGYTARGATAVHPRNLHRSNRRDAAALRGQPLPRIRIRRCIQSDIQQRLVRRRLPGHRSGTDHRHDRELPERIGVGNNEEESACRSRVEARGVYGRVAGGEVRNVEC